MSSAIRAMPQFTELLVKVERIVSRVATVMLDGISMSSLWRKSGSTTGGATRSASRTRASSRETRRSSAGESSLSKTRAACELAVGPAVAAVVIARARC